MIHDRYLGALAQEKGFLKNSMENRRVIRHHHQNTVHKGIILDLKKKAQWKAENEITNTIDDEKSHYVVTNRHFRLMYSGITPQFSVYILIKCNHYFFRGQDVCCL